MSIIIEKLRKVKALAERGIDGEKEVAILKLQAICAKYGIRYEDLDKVELIEREIKFYDKIEKQLIIQIIGVIIEPDERNFYRRRSRLLIDLSDAEWEQFKHAWNFHKGQFKKERAKAIRAILLGYIHKHDIFTENQRNPTDEKHEQTDLDLLEMMVGIMSGMENNTYHKALTQK